MDFPAQLNIAEDLTCPMCLQLLTEPLSLDCGHSFCQDCITANNESVSAPGGECPVCQSRYQPWNLRPNLQLANIVKKLREVNTTSQQWQEADLCEQHGENRLIFCKEDGKAICKLCVLSVEHHGHQMFPIEQVAQECAKNAQSLTLVVLFSQGKLQEALKKLTEEEQEAEKLEADISEETATWETRILEWFVEMRGILDQEERKELQKLEEDAVNVLNDLAVAKDQVAWQRQCMREDILDLQHQIWGSSRKKSLSGVFVNGKEKAGVIVGDTRISAAICEQEEPQKSGQVFTRYQPKYDHWVIGLCNQFVYNALEDSSSSDPLMETLFLTVPPCHVGVFLDCKADTSSFFNVTNLQGVESSQ
ncbi:E3 ubiquitin-protein ligase TRIM22-like [Hipposideros larvatus]